MIEEKEAGSLVEDFTLYPRKHVDNTHVLDIAESLSLGKSIGNEIPPIVISADGVIVDGVHRKRAAIKAAGPTATVICDVREYKSKKELYIDAMALNSPHGKPLKGEERAYAIKVALELKVDPEQIASAMNMSVDRIRSIAEMKIVKVAGTNMHTTVKNSAAHLRGVADKDTPEDAPLHHASITKKQAKAMESMPGTSQKVMIKQVIIMIEGDLLNVENPEIMTAISKLYNILRKFLATQKIA
jgi:ParB-like chromosome segregation protein Spo0J